MIQQLTRYIFDEAEVLVKWICWSEPVTNIVLGALAGLFLGMCLAWPQVQPEDPKDKKKDKNTKEDGDSRDSKESKNNYREIFVLWTLSVLVGAMGGAFLWYFDGTENIISNEMLDAFREELENESESSDDENGGEEETIEIFGDERDEVKVLNEDG